MCARIAEKFGGWPHEVAAFPFHYYKALKDEYVIALDREAAAMRRATIGKNDLGEDNEIDLDERWGIKGKK